MGNKANARKMVEAIDQVLAANKNMVEVLTEVVTEETDKPEDVKEAMDAFGGLVQAFFGINVGMQKLRAPLVGAIENEKTD